MKKFFSSLGLEGSFLLLVAIVYFGACVVLGVGAVMEIAGVRNPFADNPLEKPYYKLIFSDSFQKIAHKDVERIRLECDKDTRTKSITYFFNNYDGRPPKTTTGKDSCSEAGVLLDFAFNQDEKGFLVSEGYDGKQVVADVAALFDLSPVEINPEKRNNDQLAATLNDKFGPAFEFHQVTRVSLYCKEAGDPFELRVSFPYYGRDGIPLLARREDFILKSKATCDRANQSAFFSPKTAAELGENKKPGYLEYHRPAPKVVEKALSELLAVVAGGQQRQNDTATPVRFGQPGFVPRGYPA